jgi:hypothetical protein
MDDAAPRVNWPSKPHTYAHEPLGLNPMLGQQVTGQGNRVLDQRFGRIASGLTVSAVVSVAMQVDQRYARTTAADVYSQDVALVAEESPAIAREPVLHERLRVVHSDPPSRLPSG